MVRRHLENVAIRNRLHLVNRVRRYAVCVADLKSNVGRLAVRPVLPNTVDDLSCEQIDRLVFHVVILHREGVARVDVQDLADVIVSARPDRFMPPGLGYVRDVYGTGHRVAGGEQSALRRARSADRKYAIRSALCAPRSAHGATLGARRHARRTAPRSAPAGMFRALHRADVTRTEVSAEARSDGGAVHSLWPRRFREAARPERHRPGA